jgi:hypothetical protein
VAGVEGISHVHAVTERIEVGVHHVGHWYFWQRIQYPIEDLVTLISFSSASGMKARIPASGATGVA